MNDKLINESLRPLIRQIRDIDNKEIKEALCASLLEMCDELIPKEKLDDDRAGNANDRVRL